MIITEGFFDELFYGRDDGASFLEPWKVAMMLLGL